MVRWKKSYTTAVITSGILALWILSGALFETKETSKPSSTLDQALSKNQESANKPRVSVRTAILQWEPYVRSLVVQGRTEALRKVKIAAETSGKISRVPLKEGARVKKGDVLCEIDPKAKYAMVQEAKAMRNQRQLEYQISQKLAAQGYRSPAQVSAAKAAYEAAKALLAQRKNDLANITIKAPFDAILEQRFSELGDYLRPGDSCALLVDDDPMLVLGELSEQEVNQVSVGQKATAKLVTGEQAKGAVRFVAQSANQATRTFRMEMEVPNPRGELRDGVTAQITVPVQAVKAHRVPSAVLTLNDAGMLGVRLIVKQNIVQFTPVTVLADVGEQGLWVVGLPQEAEIITVGQEFVIDGQAVEVRRTRDGVPNSFKGTKVKKNLP